MTSSTTPVQATLDQIYAEHRDRLLRLAFLLVGSRDHAEDVVQTVFTSAHERWVQIEQPVPYLNRAVVNACADLHRRRLRRPPLPSIEPVTQIPELDETWQALRLLPARQRAVVVLHYYEDRPLTEIADILRTPASTVRSDLRRALARLKKEL